MLFIIFLLLVALGCSIFMLWILYGMKKVLDDMLKRIEDDERKDSESV